MEQNSKTQNVTKLKNSKHDKTKTKNLIKLKTQNLTKSDQSKNVTELYQIKL